MPIALNEKNSCESQSAFRFSRLLGIWEDGETFPVALPWKVFSIELFNFCLTIEFFFLIIH